MSAIDLVLRIKAGVEAAYLALPNGHPVRAILGRVDDDVMKLHDALCDEAVPATEPSPGTGSAR